MCYCVLLCVYMCNVQLWLICFPAVGENFDEPEDGDMVADEDIQELLDSGGPPNG